MQRKAHGLGVRVSYLLIMLSWKYNGTDSNLPQVHLARVHPVLHHVPVDPVKKG